MKPVAAGEPILPHLTAAWYNNTLRKKRNPPPRKGAGGFSLGPFELLCAFDSPSSSVDRFNPVAVASVSNPIKKHCILTTNCNEYNWIIPQAKIVGKRGGKCIVSGPTFANVTVLDTEHKYVTYDDYSNTLVTANRGKASILIGDTLGVKTIFINIGNLGGGDAEYVLFELDFDYEAGYNFANFYTMDSIFIESAQLYDPLGAGVGLRAGDSGYAIKASTGYHFVNAPCPTGS
jgi:hypothetical protein